MNLEGAPCDMLDINALPPEDRWILARLSQTIRRCHQCMQGYQFSATVKELREFFWDSLCDWYIELTKPRMTGEFGEREAACARQVLAFCIDQILRLFHPIIPFITERLWDQLNVIAPQRGLPGVAELATDSQLVRVAFPPVDGYPTLEDEAILKTFAGLQDATRGVRELRTTYGVSPKQKVRVTVNPSPAETEPGIREAKAGLPGVGTEDHVRRFRAHAHIVKHMAGVDELIVAPGAKRPPNAASVAVRNLRIYVHDVCDDEAEKKRTAKALEHLQKQVAGKEAKLANEKFLANAKPEIVEAERKRLAELVAQRKELQGHLAELEG
jgi:valyl-tRNA synthetase